MSRIMSFSSDKGRNRASCCGDKRRFHLHSKIGLVALESREKKRGRGRKDARKARLALLGSITLDDLDGRLQGDGRDGAAHR